MVWMRPAIPLMVLSLGLAACEERTPVASSAAVSITVTPTPVPVRLACPELVPGLPPPPNCFLSLDPTVTIAETAGVGGRMDSLEVTVRDLGTGHGPDAPHARQGLDRRTGRHGPPRGVRQHRVPARRQRTTRSRTARAEPGHHPRRALRGRQGQRALAQRPDQRGVSLRFRVLGSGSTGNATLVEGGGGPHPHRRRPGSARAGGAAAVGRRRSRPASSAIFLSHEHQDHAKGAVSFSRKWGVRLCGSRGTYAAMGLGAEDFAGYDVLEADRPRAVGELTVRGVPVPHDAAGPYAFVVANGSASLGHATDFGHVNRPFVDGVPRLRRRARRVQPRPRPAAPRRLSLVAQGAHPRARAATSRTRTSRATWPRASRETCRTLVLAHLSQKNNHPELAAGLRGLRAAPPRAHGSADPDHGRGRHRLDRGRARRPRDNPAAGSSSGCSDSARHSLEHVRISSPPITDSCDYGIDTPTRGVPHFPGRARD